MYTFVLGIWIILVFNFSYFFSYTKKFNSYLLVDKLKLQPILEFDTGLNLPENITKTDKFNIAILAKDFKKADKILSNVKTFDHKKLYNLWNLYLLKSYSSFLSTGDYVKYAQNALSYYEISLKSSPSYIKKKNIIYNLNLSKNFLNLAYVYFCDNMFLNFIKKTEKIDLVLNKALLVLKQQNKALEKWYYYNDLKKCIDSLKADSSRNIEIIYDNKDFFKKTKIWLIYKMQDFVDNEDTCYAQKDLFFQKYGNSLDSSLKYFNEFLKLQSDLLKVYQKADYFQMKLLCENKNKLSKKLSKKNKKMEENYKNLSDLANKPKPNRNKEKNKQDKEENNKGKTKVDKKFKEYTKDLIKELKEQNKDYIKKLIREKSKEIYDPASYIKNLFKDFYWNDVYYKEKKVQNSGK